MQRIVDVSIGIATYNRVEALKKCLDSIVAQSVYPKNIIVFDSGQEKAEKLVGQYENLPICYLSSDMRLPLPAVRNKILEKVESKIISFIDDDTQLDQHWLESLYDVYESCDRDSIAGVTGPAINCDKHGTPLEKIITTSRNLNYITSWGDVRYEGKRWIPPGPVVCDVMIGCNMSFFCELLKKTGGFDSELFNPSFREDTEAEMRLIKMGYRFLYDPRVCLKHFPDVDGGITDIERSKKYFYLAGKNHRHFVDKYFPKWLTRLSWIFWSRNPPSLILSAFLTIVRKKNYFYWHKGLWEKE